MILEVMVGMAIGWAYGIVIGFLLTSAYYTHERERRQRMKSLSQLRAELEQAMDETYNRRYGGMG